MTIVNGQMISQVFLSFFMRIGLIAEKTGVSRDTIRLYENMGLLTGITRPHKYNNYKEYAEENIERIQLIIMMKNLGLRLKECKQVLLAMENEEFNLDFQKEFLQNKMEEIDRKVKDLLQLRKTLSVFLEQSCDRKDIQEKIKKEKKTEP